jgi:hypothetical protein
MQMFIKTSDNSFESGPFFFQSHVFLNSSQCIGPVKDRGSNLGSSILSA